MGIIAPVLPLYATSFEVSTVMVGSLISAVGVSRLFLDIPTGLWIDRVGARRLMLSGLVLVVSSALLAWTAPNFGTLFAAMVLQGAGAAMYFTSAYAAMARTVPRLKRGKHLSFYLSMQFLGAATGPVLGGVVSQQFGLSTPFLVFGLFVAGSGALLYRFLPRGRVLDMEAEPGRRLRLKDMTVLLRDPTLLSIDLGLLAVSFLRLGLISAVLPLFGVLFLGLTTLEVGLALGLSSLGNLLVMLPAGSLTDRYGRRPFLVTSLALTGVMVLAIPFTSDAMSFSVVLLLVGASLGLSGPMGAWVTDVSRPEQLGTSMGLFRTMGDVGAVLGPFVLVSILSLAGGVLPFAVTAVLLLGVSALLYRARDPVGERRPRERQRSSAASERYSK